MMRCCMHRSNVKATITPAMKDLFYFCRRFDLGVMTHAKLQLVNLDEASLNAAILQTAR